MNGPSEPRQGTSDQSSVAVAPPLLAHLDRLMDELYAQAAKALNDWDEEAIHRARVATRRLSAALDLVKTVIGKKRRKALSKVLRRLRRRLGPLRDADVMIGHLNEVSADAGRYAAAVDWTVAALSKGREQLRQNSAAQGAASQVLADLGVWHPVREQIAATGDALSSLLTESLHLQLDAFVEQAARVVGGVPGPGRQDPHELRIAGKALRYTLEMAAAQGHDMPGSLLKTFKRMQEQLGAWHDFVVITDSALRLSLESQLSHHDAGLQEKVLDLARLTLRRSARQLDQFGRLWVGGGERLAAAIRAAFPLTRGSPPALDGGGEPVSESKKDHGLRDSTASEAPAEVPPAAPSAAS